MEYLLNSIYLQKIHPASFRAAHPRADLPRADTRVQPQPNHPKVTGVTCFYYVLPRRPSPGTGKLGHLQADHIFNVIAKLQEADCNHLHICSSVLNFVRFLITFSSTLVRFLLEGEGRRTFELSKMNYSLRVSE